MGKVLIIKGADFSGVNVDIIPVFVNSELDLTKQNYLRSAQTYISSEGKWGTGGANTKTLFWPISAGQILRLGSNPDDGLYLVTIISLVKIKHLRSPKTSCPITHP